jgi:proteasome alpha subunit
MTEEPYRWLEAIGNRREYISEQMKGGTPVFAHGFAALGHPVDIEKLRQAAIEAAHVEGFNRSSKDVTLRRLISFALSTTLKNSFEQIFSPPFIVESIFAELGETPAQDVLVRVHYDGNHHYETSGVLVAGNDRKIEEEAAAWIRRALKAEDSLSRAAGLCLTVWQTLSDNKPIADLAVPENPPISIAGKTVEASLLDRKLPGPVHYRPLELK